MTTKAEQAAEKLGTSAGRRFQSTGVPVKNPLEMKGPKGLAAAWRRAYLAAATPRKIRR